MPHFGVAGVRAVGTISSLMDRLARKTAPNAQPIVATAFGFAMGEDFVAWQAVAEIWGHDVQSDHGDVCLEFSCNGQSVWVAQRQQGFVGLEQVMVAVFPSTAGWRQSVMNPTIGGCRTLLFRRA